MSNTDSIAYIDQNEQAKDARRLRGLEIAATSKLVEADGEWIVPSQSGSRSYRVNLDEQRCNCPDFEASGVSCWALCSIARRSIWTRASAATFAMPI